MRMIWKWFFGLGFLAVLVAAPCHGADHLNPRGRTHIPIGIANSLDSLKTFVEAEGNFSPGFATYGIYFWIYDPVKKELASPTLDHVAVQHGLTPSGALIPWSSWSSFGVQVRSEVCEVTRRDGTNNLFYITAARVFLTNSLRINKRIFLYAALRPMGAAGGKIQNLAVGERGDLLVNGHPALVSNEKPSASGVEATDTVGELAFQGIVPVGKEAWSEAGECSGLMRFDLELAPGQTRALGFICPVLPGRRAVPHQWDGVSSWAQLDLADPNTLDGGVLQPDPGLSFYQKIRANTLFDEAREYWREMVGRYSIKLPDRTWVESFNAIVGHSALCLNDGAPDVAVINYNVFNRDGVYLANILQKAGQFELAAKAIDYFLAHPFNGRVQPEADNPGQILWIMGEHWRFTRDQQWLKRVYPLAIKLARMIEYYRTTPGPHWVNPDSLQFGEALPEFARQELKPGNCDGFHPEYTEAFDIAGLRGAALLAEAMAEPAEGNYWRRMAEVLHKVYDHKFGKDLAKDYGSYSVLWPCRLYPFGRGKAFEDFQNIPAQESTTWRYFPLARAHQALLAGNRQTAYITLMNHLDHPQMKGWYAFDEGGKSGSGGWKHALTTWNSEVAMPHGWALAEFHLLLRDSLLFEDGEKLVLLGGVPPLWLQQQISGSDPVRLQDQKVIAVEYLPTHFGNCSFQWVPNRVSLQRDEAGNFVQRGDPGATLLITGSANPPQGYVVRLPAEMKVEALVEGRMLSRQENGDFQLPRHARKVQFIFPTNVLARQ